MSALPALIDPQTSEVLAPRARTARRLAGAWTGTSAGQGVPLPETKPRAKPVARPSITELPAAPEARPFVKWAGGKRQLLAQLMTHVPQRFGVPLATSLSVNGLQKFGLGPFFSISLPL